MMIQFNYGSFSNILIFPVVTPLIRASQSSCMAWQENFKSWFYPRNSIINEEEKSKSAITAANQRTAYISVNSAQKPKMSTFNISSTQCSVYITTDGTSLQRHLDFFFVRFLFLVCFFFFLLPIRVSLRACEMIRFTWYPQIYIKQNEPNRFLVV